MLPNPHSISSPSTSLPSVFLTNNLGVNVFASLLKPTAHQKLLGPMSLEKLRSIAPSIVEVLRGQADLISDLSPSLSLTTYQFRIKDLLSSHSSSFVSEIYGKVASHLLRA